MKLITLNNTNLVATDNSKLDYQLKNGNLTGNMTTDISGPSFNSQYIYTFPTPITLSEHSKLSLISVGMFFSWYNITGLDTNGYYNNTFFYRWVDGVLYSITFPDGNYVVDSLNCYIQWILISRKHFLISSDGSFVFYIELVRNPTFYTDDLIVYPLPDTLGTYSYPPDCTWTLPATPTTPIVYIPNYQGQTNTAFTLGELAEMEALSRSNYNNFGKAIGFVAGKYPTTAQSTTQCFQSTKVSVLDRVTGINIYCSLCNNNFSNPCNLLQNIYFTKDSYDQFVIYENKNLTWQPSYSGRHTRVIFDFKDQYGNPLKIIDTNLNFTLAIADETENI